MKHTTFCLVVLFANALWVGAATAQTQPSSPSDNTNSGPSITETQQEGGGGNFFGKEGGGGSLSSDKCESANQGFLIEAGATNVGAIVLFFAFLSFVARMNWFKFLGGGALRFFVLLIPFMLAAGGLVWYLRATSNLVARCVANSSYEGLILAGGWDAWAVGVTFGLAPVLVLSALLKLGKSALLE